MFNLKLSFFLLILFPFVLFSQDIKKCNSSEKNSFLESKFPQIKESRNQLEKFTKKFISKVNRGEQIYIIPVVFHVVHNNGTENISKAQILDEIRILNEDFRKLNPDTNDVVPSFKNIAADCKIEFRLAQIAPDGSCTEGITRTQSTLTNNANDDVKYIAKAWHRDKYFNIWVTKSVEGAAGYAYYPSDWTSAEIDGILIDNTYVGSIGTGSYSRARALTHEVGHSMNLMHPWGDTNEPGLSDNCNYDDMVDDTPNTIGHTTCVLNSETCGSLDNVQNYMEYAYCDRMFTIGQKNRMRAALNSSIAERNKLWQESNLIATGTNSTYQKTSCIPIVDFMAEYSNTCTDNLVKFYDLTYNADVDSTWIWTWNFPDGNPSSSSQQNPLITYTKAGNYSATLKVENSSGFNQIEKLNIIKVDDKNSGEFAPYNESFENASFPVNITNPDKNWEIEKGDEINFWQISSDASYSGQMSAKLNNNNIVTGTKNSLISCNIVIDTLATNTLSFMLAYARTSTSSKDNLKMYISPNCGKTWHLRYSKSGGSLDTNGGIIVTDNFIPTSNEWRKENISLGNYADSTHLKLKFECTSGGGNNLYIDDVILNSVTGNEIIENNPNYINIYPNPITENSKIEFALARKSNLNFTIIDITGKVIYKYKNENSPSEFSLNINELIQLQKGIYFVNFEINGFQYFQKILKLE